VTDRLLARPALVDVLVGELELPARARRRETIGRLALVAGDLIAVTVAMLGVARLFGAEFTLEVFALLPLYALLAKMAGLYDRDGFVLRKTTLDEGPALVAAAAIFVLVLEAVQALEFTGRAQPLQLWGLLTIALIAARAIVRFIVVRTTAVERILVIGDAATTVMIRRKLAGDRGINATIVGRVSTQAETPERVGDRSLGTVGDLPTIVREGQIERVIVAPTLEGGEDVVDIIRLATACGVRISVLPRMLEVVGTSVEFDDLNGRPLLGLRGFGLTPSSRVLKRAFDLAVATTLVVLIAPVLLTLAIAVKLSSPGPALFRQARIGRHGGEFQLLKFRTMVNDADQRKEELLAHNEAAPLFKIANDPRTTRVGRFLRKRSLDELPQLLNVLRGDMSMVGPRPLIPAEDRLFSGWQRRRYHVAPGITGPWQILGSSRVPVNDMVTLDYLYCANWSLWLDAKILARTVPYVLSRRSGEHVGTTR
jgi:exopolysaccharide biosynthesis polyprenyl glycosylphosphotransferase